MKKIKIETIIDCFPPVSNPMTSLSKVFSNLFCLIKILIVFESLSKDRVEKMPCET